jgi:hypothetical protein
MLDHIDALEINHPFCQQSVKTTPVMGDWEQQVLSTF